MQIICDYRERDAIKSIKSLVDKKEKNILVVDENLSLETLSSMSQYSSKERAFLI